MPASVLIGDSILNCYLRGVVPVPPVRLWVSLHTADPTVTGANEVSLSAWPAYKRVDPSFGGLIDTAFTPSSGKLTANAQRMEYGIMDGPVPLVITHFALWNALVGGQMYIYGALDVSKTLAPSDECVINPSKLQATVI
jgi:hypothetical protein